MSGIAPPLLGFRVLDCTDELGVYATKLLVELGAEVVRLEPPGGDPMRRFPPFADDEGSTSLYFAHFNAGKRFITLELDDEECRVHLRRLLATCHAVVESGQAPDLLSRRLGVAWLNASRPGLVLVSVTPSGLTHPNADQQRAGDLTLTAASGLLWLSGHPDTPPYRPGGEQAAHMAGLIAANAALLGILQQGRTGQGIHVEVPALFAAALATAQTANANYLTWLGRIPARRGFGLDFARHIYPAADGWVALTALPGQWPNLVRLLADHAAAADLADAAYNEAKHRIEQAAHINDVVIAFTSRYPKAYIFESGQHHGLAVTPVNTAADLAADPFLNERGFFRTLYHPELGRSLRYPGPPVRLDGRREGTRWAARVAGHDNHRIWMDELGMDNDTFAALQQRQAL